MSHSLIGADGRTHCKIVAVALAGSISLVMLSIGLSNGWRAETKAAMAQARTYGPVLRAGGPTISATRDAPIIR
jgi:hypothetical protein